MNFGKMMRKSFEVKIEEVPILQLIPQRRPFVMVDRVVAFSASATTCAFTVDAGCLFVEDGRLAAEGVVENVAQTCAARMGCISYLNHEAVKLGYIGAVRGMSFRRLPMVGETLLTTIRVREEVFRMTLVDAEVRIGDEVVASAEMKIALSEIEMDGQGSH